MQPSGVAVLEGPQLNNPVIVTVYTTSACQPCKATKRKLDMLGVPYVEIAADADPAIADELKARGFTQSPVVELTYEGRRVDAWSGYQPDKVNSLKGRA
jgi:glutaredoxin-like protein NrdH